MKDCGESSQEKEPRHRGKPGVCEEQMWEAVCSGGWSRCPEWEP